jgi:hypothetical protein
MISFLSYRNDIGDIFQMNGFYLTDELYWPVFGKSFAEEAFDNLTGKLLAVVSFLLKDNLHLYGCAMIAQKSFINRQLLH